MRVIVSLREGKDFCYHITKIMVYDFSCNGWDEKKKSDLQSRELKTKFPQNSICNSELFTTFVASLAPTGFVGGR